MTLSSFEMMAERSSEDDNGTEVARILPSYSVPSNTTRDWRLFNVVLLGVTFLFVFTAFQTCSMVEVCDGTFSLFSSIANTKGSRHQIPLSPHRQIL